jgi:dUTP pyrophosphatase
MSSNISENKEDLNKSIFNKSISHLLKTYESVMLLNIYVGDSELKEKYINSIKNHNNNIINDPFINAGFDVFYPGNNLQISDLLNSDLQSNNFVKINFDIKCSAKIFTNNKSYYTGYYIHPRSSLSSTGLRLANSTGIIDSGYRGNIIGAFDIINNNYKYNKFDRYIQICAPGLIPIIVNMVDTVEELSVQTSREDGGFGSTGK